MEDTPTILALVRDLLFASKITATARAAGIPVRILRDPAQLTGQPGTRLLVDLNQPDTIPAAVAWKTATGGAVLGFVSHVDSATIRQARAAGIDRVLPRSEFDRTLPEILTTPF